MLLIDDDRDDAEIFEEALSEIDDHLLFCHEDDGRNALGKLVQMPASLPDMIFLDVNMPTISGWECLKALKNEHSLAAIPVVMYSTSSHHRESEQADRLGALTFITKPNNFTELKNLIKALIYTE